MKLNRKLLLRVKKHILEDPRRLIMSQWTNDGAAELFEEKLLKTYPPPCGTAGCILGWAFYLSVDDKNQQFDIGLAYKFLGSNSFNRLLDPVVYLSCWSPKFRARWRRAKLPATRARIVADRIDEFLKEHRGQ